MGKDRLVELAAELQESTESLAELDRLFDLLAERYPDAVKSSAVTLASAVQITRMSNAVLALERARLETLAAHDLNQREPGGKA